MALSQSAPTANTQELSRVVVSDPVGVPEALLKFAVAPIAPEPLLAVMSAPVKATTVIDAAPLCARFAVTVTLFNAEAAIARQISASPGTPLARATNCQPNPAPVTDVTLLPAEPPSADTNASSNSLEPVVEN